MHLAFVSALDQVLKNGLERSKAGPCRKTHNRFLGVRAQVEIPIGQLDLELVAFLKAREDLLGETPAGHAADMILCAVALLGRIRYRLMTCRYDLLYTPLL